MIVTSARFESFLPATATKVDGPYFNYVKDREVLEVTIYFRQHEDNTKRRLDMEFKLDRFGIVPAQEAVAWA